jgi:hypothetical protein
MDPLREFDNEWNSGNRELARELAREYVTSHWDELAPHLEHLSIPQLVSMVSAYRAQGREDDRIACEMWILSQVPPQSISGVINVKLPSPSAFLDK